MGTLTFNGTIFTGEGNGKKFLSLPWVKQQVEQKLGFTPYLGTLNLKLTQKTTANKKSLENTEMTIFPAEGYCVGLLFRAYIKGVKCAVVVPEVEGYPENVLEVIASVSLREALRLRDGDAVTVQVQV
ncbi:MAG: CTP-dependent riboflavin kinase [Candidatus Bathyarchaeota archaeon]|nr:CTP-dependent riboflavin kinase [Candidatus Bathyarchaeota archaeon]